MSNISTCIFVQAFFDQYNWEGIQLKQESKVEEISWECLTVKEFLKQNNWEGKALQINQEQKRREMSLTLQVKEFLELIVWEGHSKILTQPEKIKATSMEQRNSGTPGLKITDLSDLF